MLVNEDRTGPRKATVLLLDSDIVEFARRKTRDLPFEIVGEAIRCGEGRDSPGADEVDSFDGCGGLVADAEDVVVPLAAVASVGYRLESSSHGDIVEVDFEEGPDAVGREGVAPTHRGQKARAIERGREDSRETPLASSNLSEAGMTVVRISAADESQTSPAHERVTHEVSGNPSSNGKGRILGFTRAMDGDDFRYGFQLRIRCEEPVGRDGLAGRVMREGERGTTA